MKKSMKHMLSLLVISILTIGLLTGCGSTTKKDDSNNGNASSTDSSADSSTDTATVILIDEEEKEYTYELKLDGEVSVREAMIQNELVPEEEYAAMTFQTIDGHTAMMEDGVLWLLCDAEGNQLEATDSFPIDDYKVKPGDTIKFIYTVAPNFDD